jgi:hypothetical protein
MPTDLTGLKMDQRNNAALLELSKVWQLDGDWMKCRACKAVLIASRDGEPLRHKSTGCRNSARTHPWAELRDAITLRALQSQSDREGRDG